MADELNVDKEKALALARARQRMATAAPSAPSAPQEHIDNLPSWLEHSEAANLQSPSLARNALGVAETLTNPIVEGVVGAGKTVKNAVDEMRGAKPIDERTALDTAMFGLGGSAAEIGKTAANQVPKALAAAQRVAESMGDAVPNMVKATPRPAALQARMVGYVLPPAMASDKPGIVSNALAGWSGKIKTQQAASAKNQVVTNALAARSLGLPADTPLTEEAFTQLRQRAGQAYKAVADAVPAVSVDDDFVGLVKNLGGANSHAAKHFPEITKNDGIKTLVKELSEVGEFPTEAGIEVVKELRFNANANLRAPGDPSKHALGLAQREAANAVDDLMQRNIVRQAGGAPEAQKIVDEYRKARQLIARSYDVEATTNTTTGDVSARGIGKLADKGKPFTGELKIIADTANTFPKAMQNESVFGGNESHSALDFFGSALALAHGNPSVAGAIMARPVARSVLLSNPYQNRMMGVSGRVASQLGIQP